MSTFSGAIARFVGHIVGDEKQECDPIKSGHTKSPSPCLSARHIFDLAEMMGFHMELLDIGGGFTGHFDEHGHVIFGETAVAINR